jgi:hypothetical protein
VIVKEGLIDVGASVAVKTVSHRMQRPNCYIIIDFMDSVLSIVMNYSVVSSSSYPKKAPKSFSEAEFLYLIGAKVLRVFLLAIHSHHY